MNDDYKSFDSQILRKLKSNLDSDSHWGSYFNDDALPHLPRGIHVAIFVEPYLGLVLDGTKTIESRFSLKRITPYHHVERGDVILLKASGGPIVGISQVAKAWFFELTPSTWTRIKKDFSTGICPMGPDFWKQRSNAAFASLFHLSNVKPLEPLAFPKRDRRGWVTFQRKPIQRALWEA